MNINDFTPYLAVYAAVLSTVAIVWNILRDVQDRPSLVVNALYKSKSTGFDGIRGKYVSIELTNKGKRPVTIVEIGYRSLPDNRLKEIPSRGELPKMLGEAEYYSIDVLPETIGAPEEVEFVFAGDASGHVHKSNKNPLYSSRG